MNRFPKRRYRLLTLVTTDVDYQYFTNNKNLNSKKYFFIVNHNKIFLTVLNNKDLLINVPGVGVAKKRSPFAPN